MDPRDLTVDAILTAFSQEYTPEEYIGDRILPRVGVNTLTGTYYAWDAGDATRTKDTATRPGGSFHESQFKVTDDSPFVAREHGLEEFIADLKRKDWDARTRGAADYRTSTVENLTRQIANSREKRVADLVFDPAQYDGAHKVTLSGSDQWDDASSTPIEDIEGAKTLTFATPNILVVSYEVFQSLKRHQDVRDQYKYTTAKSITPELLAAMFELDAVLVGKAQETTSNPGQTNTWGRLWGKKAVLARVDPNPGPRSMTYGFSPEMVARRVLSARDSRGQGGEVVKVAEVIGETIVDPTLAYMFIDAVS